MSITRPRTRRTALTVVLGCALLSVVSCSSGSKGGSTTPSATPPPSSASASASARTPTRSASAAHSATASPSGSGSASATATATAVSSATVTIKDFAFGPAALTVAPGAKITVVNADNTTHTLTATGNKAFDTGTIAGGNTATFTAPTTPGNYPYICTIHTFMHGTLTVK